ncbi:hypothetical protein Trydic_g18119, partial [Trypoxylus dichotomus]
TSVLILHQGKKWTTGGNSHTATEETFADNLDEPSLRELIHKVVERYQRKFGEKSELDEPKTEEYIEQTKRLLAKDDSDVEDMQEGMEDEILKKNNQRQTRERTKPPDRRNKKSSNTKSHR